MTMTLEEELDALFKRLGRVQCRLLEETERRQELGNGGPEDGEGLGGVVDVARQEAMVEVGVLSKNVGGGAARHQTFWVELFVFRARGVFVKELCFVVYFAVSKKDIGDSTAASLVCFCEDYVLLGGTLSVKLHLNRSRKSWPPSHWK